MLTRTINGHGSLPIESFIFVSLAAIFQTANFIYVYLSFFLSFFVIQLQIKCVRYFCKLNLIHNFYGMICTAGPASMYTCLCIALAHTFCQVARLFFFLLLSRLCINCTPFLRRCRNDQKKNYFPFKWFRCFGVHVLPMVVQ